MYNFVHFIGIGGIGMSGIAQLFLNKGVKVSGSDMKVNESIDNLRSLGAKIFVGHAPSNIKDQDLVVYSSAIREDNPELQEAKRLKIKIVKRAEALAGLMQDKKVIAVAGAHGKTTTSGLIAHMLKEAGFSPTVVIGGIALNWDNNAYLGKGDYFVIEADESDGSLLCYHPDYSIITNIDSEHLDHYKNFSNLLNTFEQFLNNTKDNGCVIACGDDSNVSSILDGYTKRKILFGLSKDNQINAQNIRMEGLSSSFDCYSDQNLLARLKLSLAGEHNILNSLAAVSLAKALGIELVVVNKALSSYLGTQRRLEVKADNNEILVLDDYAHHPTEIKATLKSVASLGRNRIIAIFQPHRYSRTKLLLDDFTTCFDQADQIIITDIYAAGEECIDGIEAKLISDNLKSRGCSQVSFLAKDQIVDYVASITKSGDVIITLGAGDISKISDRLSERIIKS